MSSHKEWREQNRQHVNDFSREYVKANPEQRSQTTRRYRENVASNREHFIKQLIRSARTNARLKGIDFDLSFELIDTWIKIQNEKCCLTGIDFVYSTTPDFRTRPFTPSIDRKDNSGGYLAGNIQIVCCMVNRAKNEFTQEMFDRMCLARARVINGQA